MFIPWTLFPGEFNVNDLKSPNLRKYLEEILLKFKASDAVRLTSGPLVLRDKTIFQKRAFTHGDAMKPPFSKNVFRLQYFLVDIDPEEIFIRIPIFPWELMTCTVILNKLQAVTVAHVDQDPAFFVMVQGRKRFRFLKSSFCGPLTADQQDVMTKRESGDPRIFDVDLSPGDILFVPKKMYHCVHSEPNSIGISFTVNISKSSSPTEIIPTNIPRRDSTAPSTPSPHLRSSLLVPPDLMTVVRNLTAATPLGIDDDTSLASSNSNPPVSTTLPETSSNCNVVDEDDDLALLSRSISAQDKSPLSMEMSTWHHEMFPRMMVFRGSGELQQSCSELFQKFFYVDGQPKDPKLLQVPFQRLFGQFMPVDEDDRSLRSSRVLIDPDWLIDGDAEVETLLRNITDSLKASIVQKLEQSMIVNSIDIVTTQILIRGAGRIECQQEHIDGQLKFSGSSDTISVILALCPQSGTVFHYYPDLSQFPSSVLSTPRLRTGDAVGFDPDKIVHQGHICQVTPAKMILFPAIFVQFIVNAKKSSKRQYAQEARSVTNYPHNIILHVLPVPCITRCASCHSPVHVSQARDCMICSSCWSIDGNRSHAGVICKTCAHNRPSVTGTRLWKRILETYQPNSFMAYLASSVLNRDNGEACKYPADLTGLVSHRFCEHSVDHWNWFSPDRDVMLLFEPSEIQLAAQQVLDKSQDLMVRDFSSQQWTTTHVRYCFVVFKSFQKFPPRSNHATCLH